MPQRSHTGDKAVLSDLAPARDSFPPPHERSHLAPPHGWSATSLGQLQHVQLGRAIAQPPFPRCPGATQPRLRVLRTRWADLERIRPGLSSPGCGRLRRAMDWPGTGPEGPGKAARPHVGTDSSSSRSDLHRRWSAGRYMNGGRSGSVLAQKLIGAPLPLITCDDCPNKVLCRVSTTPEHPGWVFIKC